MKALTYATLKENMVIQYKRADENEDSYDVLKREVNGTLDVVSVGEIDFWVDDEFLLKAEEPKPTLIIKREPSEYLTPFDTVLCGTIVFASHDGDGDTVSLTPAALDIINKFQYVMVNNSIAYLLPAYTL